MQGFGAGRIFSAMRILKQLVWVAIALIGASALGYVAVTRGETISAGWFLTAAICIYLIAYRFYSAFLAAKVAMLDDSLSCAIVGDATTVRDGLDAFVRRTGADELMVTANIFEHAKRKRSFQIVAEVAALPGPPQGEASA